MIYLPKRALFVHIPRTAGNSISNAIASACVGRGFDIMVCNNPNEFKENWSHTFHTHSRAFRLKNSISEWNKIFKFAIFRGEKERLDSAMQLVRRDIEGEAYKNPCCNPEWFKVLTDGSVREKFYNDTKLQDFDFFTKSEDGKEDLGVVAFPFEELSDRWYEICDNCQIPRCELPHLNRK
ncbi:hypothetical protein OAK92_00950 [Crocinitomicaceae bacterium]|nr:hypothetical protein [Crocinitomicaceae bacterium]